MLESLLNKTDYHKERPFNAYFGPRRKGFGNQMFSPQPRCIDAFRK